MRITTLGRTPLILILGAVALNLLFVAWALARYPGIFAAERILWVLADIAVLLSYAVLAWIIARRLAADGQTAMVHASLLGVFAGAAQGADISREYFVDLAPPLGVGFLIGVLLFTFALFALAGARVRDVAQGAMLGIWSAMVSMLLLWILAWLLNYSLMGRLEHILVSDPDYMRGNTLRDLPSYAVWNTLSSAFSHALLLPCFGAAFGALGAALSARISRPRLR